MLSFQILCNNNSRKCILNMHSTNMKIAIHLIFFTILHASLFAQLEPGDHVPNFIATDINGNEHNLYEVLASGKTAILEFSATWCPPCWTYHEIGRLKDFYAKHGPDGTNRAEVFFIETDPATGMNDLQGLTDETLGDWLTGLYYPVIDGSNIPFKFQVDYYPTVWMICSEGNIINVRNSTAGKMEELMESCQANTEHTPNTSFYADKTQVKSNEVVKFYSESFPIADHFVWDFGDGTLVQSEQAEHSYDEPGVYTVSLRTFNNTGESIETKEDYIWVSGNCTIREELSVGETDTLKDSYTKSNSRSGLVFDVFSPLILSSVKVYSEKAGERVIGVLDEQKKCFAQKTIYVDLGEQVLDLGIYLPPGSNYTLRLLSESYLWRSIDADYFPYTIDNLLSIKSATVFKTDNWPYFYDWKVNEVDCLTSTEDVSYDKAEIFPIPTHESLFIRNAEIGQAFKIYSVSNGLIKSGRITSALSLVDLEGFVPGIYFLRIEGGQSKKFIIR